MSKYVPTRANALKLAGLASLLFAGTSAIARTSTPLVQCQPSTFDGVPVCTVDMAEYAQVGGAGPVQCPSGVSSTGRTLLCEQSFVAAINDAHMYFAAATPPSQPYLISIPAGSYDFSSQSALLPGQGGAIDVSKIAPASAGCLSGTPMTTGTVTLSGNPCLIISGAGPAQTSLTTAASLIGIFGSGVSHIMVENMTMVQPNVSTTQGTYVAQGKRLIDGSDYPTLTLDIAAGFPTPLELYNINCALNGSAGCSPAGYSTLVDAIYMRAYTNSASPQLVLSTSIADNNGQVSWGYPGQNNKIRAAIPPTQPDPGSFPHRWTVTLSGSGHRGIPSYFSQSTEGAMNLICMKRDDTNAIRFDDVVGGGTDIILNNLVLINAARGDFRGIKGTLSGGLGVQIYNTSIERGPAIGGQTPCLSSQSGGMQIGNPADPAIYGNAVYGFSADATGDDSIAIINDIGGTHTVTGGFYPQTVIMQSTIANSFARNIILTNVRNASHMSGNLRVSTDVFTQGQINEQGHCDPLVLGSGNCPVTYAIY